MTVLFHEQVWTIRPAFDLSALGISITDVNLLNVKNVMRSI